MKKSLIALAALSAFATAAQAQSNVSVYGLIDMGYNETKYTNNNNTAGSNGKTSTFGSMSSLSSGRLGFRGTEDLGGGTSAIFTLELGFQAQTVNAGSGSATTDSATNLDTTIDKARVFTVGLSDKALGTIRIGRDKAPAQLAVEKYTAGQANNAVGEFFLYDNAADFGGTNPNIVDYDATKETFSERVSGGLFYTSPKFNGITVNALVNDDKNSDNDGTVSINRKVSNTGISIAYEGIQNLSLTYAMHEQKIRLLSATAASKNELQTVGASYKLGAATLFGQWVDSSKKGTTGAQTIAQTGYQAGVGYTMGKTYLWAQTGDAEQESTAGTKTYDQKGYQLGARHDLSKRTSVYGIYGIQEATLANDNDKNKVTALNIGVRHSF